MDIERQNFMKEVDTEIERKKVEAKDLLRKGCDVSSFGNPVEWQKEVREDRVITNKVIDECFCECVKKFGSTLKKLKD